MPTDTRTSTSTQRRAIASQNVKMTAAKRPKTMVTDKVKTTPKKKPTVRPANPTTTRRGTRR